MVGARVRERRVLFWACLTVYLFTAGWALLGIVAGFAAPDREVPFLREIILATLVETSAAVVYMFRVRMREGDVQAVESAHRSVVGDLTLFKSLLETLTDGAVKARLHVLAYDAKDDCLRMYAQDGAYEDRNFRTGVEEGLGKKIVACEALRARGLRSRNLDADHFDRYKDSPIRRSLASVMAFPVCAADGEPLAVVALDMDKPLEAVSIGQAKLEAMFLKLCDVVQSDLQCLNVEAL